MAKLDNVDESALATLESSVRCKLIEMGIEISTLKSTSLNHLILIENVISERLKNQSLMLDKFKENKLSVLSISEESQISRQTFYNNPILKDYISYVIENSDLINPYKKTDILNSKLNELQSTITQMQVRDVNLELLQHEIELLKDELSQKQREIYQLKKQNIEISTNLNALKNKLTNSDLNDNIILKFPK